MATPYHVLLCPVGSAGDVYPFVGLGVALRQRGHRVTVMTSGYFAQTVQSAGLEFVDTLPEAEFLRLAGNPRLWHPIRGAKAIFDSMTVSLLRLAYQSVADRYQPGSTVAVTSCIGFGARVAHDHVGIPLVTVDLQPLVLWSKYETPALYGFLRGRWVPGWVKECQYRIGERFFIDPIAVPKLNVLRAELGLSPVRKVTRWWHSPQLILGMFPEWYAQPQPDWPTQVRLTQFPLWNERLNEPLPDDVQTFLASGDPPIVFTPGSANMFGHRFFEQAAAACQSLGRRGMFFTPFEEHLPTRLPTDIQHFRFAPFKKLLPQVAAISHHGGIGTSAQAMEAGIPQLIMPLAHDQPDNAQRMKRLGIADWLSPRRYQGPRVAAKLQRLLTDEHVAAACRQVAQRFQGVDPYAEACAAIEALIQP